MEYAHKTSNCIVGKEYLVAHAKLELFRDCGNVIIHVPIFPLKHTDPQFAFEKEHYHVDGRFDYKDAVELALFSITGGRTNNIVVTHQKDTRFNNQYKLMNVEYLVRKCLRKVTGIDPPKDSLIYNEWYNEYLGQSCAGKKCPHWGNTMITVKGKTYCPLHGLFADPEKEIIVEPY